MSKPISDDLKKFLIPAFKRKAKSITAVNVSQLSSYTDTLIIIECNSLRQVNSTAEYLIKELKKKKIKTLGMEGIKNSEWALLDYGEAVIHIFESRAKSFFDLEGLWADAPKVDLSELEKIYEPKETDNDF
jgi:ribosome-associated protein